MESTPLPDVPPADTIRRVAEFAARIAKAETALASVRALHTEFAYGCCRACKVTWPCPTIQILDATK